MRPLIFITGILLGSCVAITLGLAVVLLVVLTVGSEEQVLYRELMPLSISLALFSTLTALASGAFYGLLMERRWRYPMLAALLSGLVLTGLYYWP